MISPARDASQDLARDLRRLLDPVAFAADCGLPALDPWQSDLLSTSSNRILALCSRQSGKTTVASTRVLKRIVDDPGLGLIIAPSLRQSQEFFKAFLDRHRALEGAPRITNESALRVELENGSRVVALPASGETVRSFSAPRVLVLEEAAFLPQEVVAAVLPMLATVPDADLIGISSAGAEAGWFYGEWTNGTGWHRFEVPATKCPRISPDFLEEMRNKLGPLRFEREFMCRFTADDSALFDAEIISRAFTDEVKPLW